MRVFISVISIFALLFLASPRITFADCVSPAGSGGDVWFNNDHAVVQYCNGTDWIGFPKTVVTGSPSYDWSVPTPGPWIDNPDPIWWNPMGRAVAISGTKIVAGVWGQDGPNNKGIAYVIDASTGTVDLTINNPAPNSDDLFGGSVGIDGNMIVVGAEGDDAGATNAGTAYVFDATTGALISTLNNPNPVAEDQFGFSVALSGTTAIVGAPNANPGGFNDAGIAYVFNATTGALISTLNNPNPAADDLFGFSVALSGTTAVVGAPQDNPGGINDAGAAYVFDTTTGTLGATFNDPAPTAGLKWGWNVGAADDTAVVSGGGSHMSAAYAFDTTTGDVISTLTKPGGNINKEYNFIAISGTTAVAGAQLEGSGGTAYLFDVPTGTVLATLSNPSADPDGGDNFGGGVAISGGTVVIGAPGDDGPDADGNIGRAYVFSAQARCSAPDGPAGSIVFNADHRVLQYCDGTVWQGVGPPDPGGTVTGCINPAGAGGSLVFNADYCVMQYCDGADWRAIPDRQPDPCDCGDSGTICADGTIYAGLSPDGNVKMYATPADWGTAAWNNGNITGAVDTALENCSTGTEPSCFAGADNTTTLASADSDNSVGGTQPHLAASACNDLVALGRNDWYLPSIAELDVLHTNRASGALSGTFSGAADYWSSSEIDITQAALFDFSLGVPNSGNKTAVDNIRCVRKSDGQ